MKFNPATYRGNLVDLPEGNLVRFLTHEAGTLYSFFNFVVEPALGPPPRQGWDYLLFAEIPRSDLGLRPGQPGDVDVLIIPTQNGEPQVEFAAAIEVKRLALRGPNWSKNVDRYGITQATGLLRCGFPFVGILHLVVNESGPAQNWHKVMKARVLDQEGRVEIIGDAMFDSTGRNAAERQLDRLISRHPPSCIGLNSVSVSLDGDDETFTLGISMASSARPASRNPQTHSLMLRNLKAFAYYMGPYASLRNADARRQF